MKNFPSTDPALALENVTKTFGSTTAVDSISFHVPRGSVLALLGPNGAGKTTTIEMCEGFQKPSSGSIRVLGIDPVTQPEAVRERIGIMLQGGGAYPGIRVLEMLKLVGSYSANPLDAEWLLELVGLSAQAKTSYRRLSGGQQQRLSLAAALIGRPELVFLDEPTAGMDAQSRLKVWEVVNQMRADGVTVIITTHLMDEAEALADNVVIIDKGSIVAEGTPAQLISQANAQHATIHIETTHAVDEQKFGQDIASISKAQTLPRVEALRPLSYRVYAEATPTTIAAIARAALIQDVTIRKLSVAASSLEDVFLDLTGREMRS